MKKWPPSPGRPSTVTVGAFSAKVYSTPVRGRERFTLAWIDPARGRVRKTFGSFDEAKTAARRLAPCPEILVKWLTPRAQTEGPVRDGHEGTLHDNFRVAADRAGLAGRDNALRHSFISYRIAAIRNVPRVASEAGNSPQIVFRNYGEVVRSAVATTWFALVPVAPSNLVPLGSLVAPREAPDVRRLPQSPVAIG